MGRGGVCLTFTEYLQCARHCDLCFARTLFSVAASSIFPSHRRGDQGLGGHQLAELGFEPTPLAPEPVCYDLREVGSEIRMQRILQEMRIQKALQTRRHPLVSYSHHPGEVCLSRPSEPVVFNQKPCCPQETFGRVWRHFWLSQLEMGGREGAMASTKTSYKAQGTVPRYIHKELSSLKRQQC